jgi:hypothetical protein
MTDLRALVRELLSEEIAAIRAELLGGVQVERVRVASGADLTDFAHAVARRAQDPAFAAALRDGRIRFELDGMGHVSPAPTVAPQAQAAPQPVALVTTVPASVPELRKALVTERDIAGIEEGETRLRITKTARLTPLAGDEARRRGIRIERTLA